MSDLIERLSAATGPDRELDGDIAWAVGAAPVGAFRMSGHLDGGVFGTGAHTSWAAPSYTASIDAALTLLPEGVNHHGYGMTPNGVDAYVSRNSVASGHWIQEGTHPTSIPIAIAIAALKERTS